MLRAEIYRDNVKDISYNECLQCCGCHIQLTGKWYTCTQCPCDKFRDLCPECFDSGNYHQEHKTHMSTFIQSPSHSADYFCDACGAIFEHKDQVVYRCSTFFVSSDKYYDLCKRCYHKKRHMKHIKTFDLKRFSEIFAL